MNTTELARREERAQHGIIEFAEEMQYIRDHDLYPNAGETNGGKLEPWKTYCKERWGMGKAMVDKIILARPVMERRSHSDATRATVEAAATVATLPEKVQDKILDTTDARDDVRAKAKAARKVAKQIEQNEGRQATDDEMIEAAQNVKPPTKKPKRKMKASKFVSNLAQGHWHLEQAADIAHGEPIDDVENDYGWAMLSKFEYEIERLREKLYQPEIVKDADEAFAELLGGEER